MAVEAKNVQHSVEKIEFMMLGGNFRKRKML